MSTGLNPTVVIQFDCKSLIVSQPPDYFSLLRQTVLYEITEIKPFSTLANRSPFDPRSASIAIGISSRRMLVDGCRAQLVEWPFRAPVVRRGEALRRRRLEIQFDWGAKQPRRLYDSS
ncbi:unnamed protein product [Microthlaspi erraticum]|uniref:Uncharacterized protein n=1 Tax=Microthlaspi erraticum TaxID=1685480 RepID=A0A6D2I9Q9_9BRAS|nr:unnamed protein product [Microthlaspi erraticum]